MAPNNLLGVTLALALTPVGSLTLTGCGGPAPAPDAGPLDAVPPDAGSCSPSAQADCPAEQKCTLDENLAPACGPAGGGAAYAACRSDSECGPGTYCTDPGPLPPDYQGYQTGPACYPFCNPAQGLRQPCPQGGACVLALLGSPEVGLCDRRLDGGPADGG